MFVAAKAAPGRELRHCLQKRSCDRMHRHTNTAFIILLLPLLVNGLSQHINDLLMQQNQLQRQQQKQQQQQKLDTGQWQDAEQQRQLDQWQQEELQQQQWEQQHGDQGTEYMMATNTRISSAFSRRLQQQAPAMCGKLGTYIPNYFTSLDGSMFGLALSPNTDGSIIGVGAPLNAIDAAIPGRAMLLTSWSDQTCEYAARPVWQPPGGYRYFGAQVALSEDGTTFAVMDGVEGIQTPSLAGNRPVVHVYRRFTNGTYMYLHKLNTAPRKAMAAAMAVSITADAQSILVSYSIGEGFPDKVGSAQVFVLNGTSGAAQYTYMQDLATLNMPAGSSIQFGASSVLSSDGQTVVVTTAANTNPMYKMAYMYRKDEFTGRFRIVSAISGGEYFPDPWPMLSGVGITDDNAVAMSQTGRFVLRVEMARLVVYEWSGGGMTMTWKRRCQITAPDGYTFRTTGSSLSIIEMSKGIAKFAAGAYIGTLEAPEQMAVFLYYLNTMKAASCPFRPAEKHVHNDPFSSYGAGVAITPRGNLLIVGAPTTWDNNMDFQIGAVYMMDISTVDDDGLFPKTVTPAANKDAGCVNGLDPNGNPCVDKMVGFDNILCRDVRKKDGTIIHYGAPGCSPTPSPPSFWTTASVDDEPAPAAPFRTATVSAYTQIAPSVKGGVGVPTVNNKWLTDQVKAANDAAYFGVPLATQATNPKKSIVAAAGWPSSVTPALGGIPGPPATAAPPPGVNVLSLLSGVGDLLSRGGGAGERGGGGGGGGAGGAMPVNFGGGGGGGGGGGSIRSLGVAGALPAGAVITNPEVLGLPAGH